MVRQGEMINKQINECLRQLNILHDMVAMKYTDRWDLNWHLDQIENAKICVEKIKDGEQE